MRRLHRYVIADPSMAPALLSGDYVVARGVGTVTVTRGSIVVYPHPHQTELKLAKRVIGLPGERVEAREGRVEVDGDSSLDTWARDRSPWSGTWTIPRGSVFLLGDQRLHSGNDSRRLGPIEIGQLERVIFRYWPVRRITRF